MAEYIPKLVAGLSGAEEEDAKVVVAGVVADSVGFKGAADEDASGDRAVPCQDRAIALGQIKPAASASRLCSIVEGIEKRRRASRRMSLSGT